MGLKNFGVVCANLSAGFIFIFLYHYLLTVVILMICTWFDETPKVSAAGADKPEKKYAYVTSRVEEALGVLGVFHLA